MSSIAFFTLDPEHTDSPDEIRFLPTRYAASLWAPGTLNGPAVCALAARAAERGHSVAGFRPARFTIDLFKVARDIPTATRGRLLRDGGRIKVAEVEVEVGLTDYYFSPAVLTLTLATRGRTPCAQDSKR